jgi:hypothetical protein
MHVPNSQYGKKMSSLNKKANTRTEMTHEGAMVRPISAEAQLERMTLAAMLWEDTFYVDGVTLAEKIKELVVKVPTDKVQALAAKARTEFKLRHIPLLLARELARGGRLTASGLDAVIQRADEMGEFMSMYWSEGKTAVSAQVKKGLAKAFVKFNEYQLAKNDKNSAAVSVRDVMFISHPKPTNDSQAEMFKRVANKELKTPDTWEVALSAGADKKETFSRLMEEGKLGALAFLRNLRNMINAGITEKEIRAYARNLNVDMVLPFRYVSAAKIVPQLEDMLEEMMLRSLERAPKLPGRTVLMVDVSGSMWHGSVSAKSDLTRFDAAAALAMMAREICEEVAVYTFSNCLVKVIPRRGFAVSELLSNSQVHGGTYLGNAMQELNIYETYDRVIVFTDEQSADIVPNPKGKGYILNVASYENGINSGAYTTITGFSEAALEYIRLSEKSSES